MVFTTVSPYNKLEVSPIYHQNHRNALKNTSIFNWSLQKTVTPSPLTTTTFHGHRVN
ncbi:hypothetical protein E2C01_009381 [Portunus trituberculatus]|uniref:Uncharacterized protein n=1 Tax=Portunus trituberculatus TaxID=210409 RepID=A0A5B7D3D7_PORTR|nr:hypothetical protein [Portunus trituberculatus]